MAIVRVQSKSGRSGSTAALVTFTSTPTSGNRLFAVVDASAAASTHTLSGSGWVQIGSVDHASPFGITVWSKVAGASEPAAITATVAGVSSVDLHLMEYSGLTATSPVDAKAISTATSSTTVSSGTTIPTSQAVELWLAAFGGNATVNSPAPTFTNGFALIESTSRLVTAEKIVSTIGSAESTVTMTAVGREAGIVLTIGAQPSVFFIGWGLPI